MTSDFLLVPFGVGAPKRTTFKLPSLNVLVPRWRVSEWQFKLLFYKLSASPFPVQVRQGRLPPFECYSNTDGCRGADKPWSETDNANRS